jgi:hypothetical protein
MRSKRQNTKKTKTRRFHKKGGNTSSDLAISRMEEGLRPRNKRDSYIIDIKPSSRSSSSIPPPPPLPLSDSDSFKSVIEEILPLPQKKSKKNLHRKKSFPYQPVVVDLYDIEGMVHDNRPFPPKALPIQFEVSPPLAKKKRHIPNILSTFMSDVEDYNIPFSDTKPLPSKIILRDGRVQNQGFNPLESWSAEKERPSDLGFGIKVGRKQKTKRRYKHSKKHHKKTRR